MTHGNHNSHAVPLVQTAVMLVGGFQSIKIHEKLLILEEDDVVIRTESIIQLLNLLSDDALTIAGPQIALTDRVDKRVVVPGQVARSCIL